MAITRPSVRGARAGVDVASWAVLEKLGEVGGWRGGSRQAHCCIDEIQAKVDRCPLGVTGADLLQRSNTRSNDAAEWCMQNAG